MRKLVLHIVVACMTLFFGIGLTNLAKFVFGTAGPAPITQERAADVVNLIGADEQHLIDIYREYGPAQTRHDRAFFERVEDDNFVLFLGDVNLSREQDIRMMENSSRDVVYDSHTETIKIFGDGAVVTRRMDARYPNGQKDSWEIIDVWVKNAGEWKILSTTSLD
jgi:hypothetical protein